MNDIVSLFVVFFVFKALGGTLKSLSTETSEMISEETDKGNDLSANNVIPQGQNILRAFSCADSNGFVEGNCMPMLQDTYRQTIPQTQVAV